MLVRAIIFNPFAHSSYTKAEKVREKGRDEEAKSLTLIRI